ncbi:thiol peroxidase [bacterium]|nr:MAG: thiol peroxidase [bacterium]
MTVIKLKGSPINTVGELPKVGTKAPDFILTKKDLSDTRLLEFKGKKVVLNIFVSLDTDVCAQSVRRFNEAAAQLENTVVLCISKDLPFAQARFCGAEGLDDVMTLSAFRYRSFGNSYGVRITDGPLSGLLSRAIVVLDETGKVIYTEQVPEITQEPDYDAALASFNSGG